MLDDEGFIKFIVPVNEIEAEATSYAIRNKDGGLKGAARSAGTVA